MSPPPPLALPLELLKQIFTFLPTTLLDDAVERGDLAFVRLLVTINPAQCTTHHMDHAASRGHLEIVRYLHHKSSAGCTDMAMHNATVNGHLEIVKFLHQNRTEGYPEYWSALRHGHLAVVRYLIHAYPDQIPSNLLYCGVDWEKGIPHDVALSVCQDVLMASPSIRTVDAKEQIAKIAPVDEGMDYLRLLYEVGQDKEPSKALVEATRRGHCEVMQYLLDKNEGFVEEAMNAAVKLGRINALQLLVQQRSAQVDPNLQAIWLDLAAERRQIPMVHYLREAYPGLVCSLKVLCGAVSRPELFDLLRHRDRPDMVADALTWILTSGPWNVLTGVQQLLPHCTDQGIEDALAGVTCNLQSVSFLHISCVVEEKIKRIQQRSHISDGDAELLFDTEIRRVLARVHLTKRYVSFLFWCAPRYDKWDIVMYLAEKRIQDMHRVMMTAISDGRLDIIRYVLVETPITDIPSSQSDRWIERAARQGRLDAVVCLHEHAPGLGATPFAMDRAAALGYFDIVQYLHTNRSDSCTTNAMDGAAARNHLEIVRFLHENRQEGCSKKAFEKACERGHNEMVDLLVEIVPDKCNVTMGIELATKHGRLETVALLESVQNRTVP